MASLGNAIREPFPSTRLHVAVPCERQFLQPRVSESFWVERFPVVCVQMSIPLIFFCHAPGVTHVVKKSKLGVPNPHFGHRLQEFYKEEGLGMPH